MKEGGEDDGVSPGKGALFSQDFKRAFMALTGEVAIGELVVVAVADLISTTV